MTCIALSLKPYEIIIILIWPAGTIACGVLDDYVLLCNSYHIVLLSQQLLRVRKVAVASLDAAVWRPQSSRVGFPTACVPFQHGDRLPFPPLCERSWKERARGKLQGLL